MRICCLGNLSHFEATGDPIISTGYLHYRMNFKRKNRLSYENYYQGLFDHSRLLDLRLLVGGGLKYRVLKTSSVESDIGLGVFV